MCNMKVYRSHEPMTDVQYTARYAVATSGYNAQANLLEGQRRVYDGGQRSFGTILCRDTSRAGMHGKQHSSKMHLGRKAEKDIT